MIDNRKYLSTIIEGDIQSKPIEEFIIMVDNRIIKFDFIFAKREGIYVILICNYKGDISGAEEEINWKISYGKDKSKLVKNPMVEMRESVALLRRALPNNNIIPLLIFTKASSIKDIKGEFNKVLLSEYSEYMSREVVVKLSIKEMDKMNNWCREENIKLNRVRRKRNDIKRNFDIEELYENKGVGSFGKIVDILYRRSLKSEISELLMSISKNEIFSEVIICGGRAVGKLDYVFIREDGIFVIEVCNYNGGIESDSMGIRWCCKSGNRVKEIKDPTMNMYESTEVLKEVIGNEYSEKIKRVMIFTEASSIDRVNCRYDAIRIFEVEEYFKVEREKIISIEEGNKIKELISMCNIRDEKIRKKRRKLNCNYNVTQIQRNEKIEEVDRVNIIREMRREIN